MDEMGLRVAFLAAECEPWAKTGGLADVVDALARALGDPAVDGVDGPVDVFLPRYRGGLEPDPSAVLGETTLAVPDPRARTGSSSVRVIDVAADGYRLRLVDHPAAYDRAGFYGEGDTDYADNAWRFGLFGRAALEALRAEGRPHRRPASPRLAGGARRHLPGPVVRGRSDRRERGGGDDAPQSRVSRLDREHGGAPARAAPGWRCARPERGRRRPARGRHRGGRHREHGLADVCARSADARVRDGPRSVAPEAWRPIHRDPQRARHGSLGSRHGPGSCRAVRAWRPRREGGVSGGAAATGRVRSGRRRAGHRDDRATGSTEGLRPAGRCDPGTAGGRRARGRPGNGPRVAGRSVSCARVGITGPCRAHRAVRSRDGARDLCRCRLLRDAVAVRAVRSGPDDRPALRDAADRAPHGRPGRHRRRRDRGSGAGDRLRVRRADPGGAGRRRRASVRAARRGWRGVGRSWSIGAWPSTSIGGPARHRSTSRPIAGRSRSGGSGRRSARTRRSRARARAPRSSRSGGSAAANGGRRGS